MLYSSVESGTAVPTPNTIGDGSETSRGGDAGGGEVGDPAAGAVGERTRRASGDGPPALPARVGSTGADNDAIA